jgi:Ca-activated chloride channel family protein
MSFIWPTLLLALLCVPLLILLYLRIQQRRRKFAAQYGNLGVARDTSGKRGTGVRRHVPAMIFLTGITLLLISMARPQATVSLPRVEGTVILTFDVSGSMAADDLKPTRMEAAKAAALDFVSNQPSSVLIGVVAFSDGGISVQAPTKNRDETVATIERLVPRRGTSIGNGILVALNTIAVSEGDPPILNNANLSSVQSPDQSVTPVPSPQGWYTSAVIVLLTDGENNQSPDPAAATDLAADLGVRIYTVGIGSPEGAIITVEGFTVHSQLNEPMLQYIAETSGGQYYNAGNAEELHQIYNDLEPKLSIKTEEMEVTSIFAGIGLLIFLIGGVLSLLWFGHIP